MVGMAEIGLSSSQKKIAPPRELAQQTEQKSTLKRDRNQ